MGGFRGGGALVAKRVSFKSGKHNLKLIVVMAAHICDYTKSH